MKVNTLRASVQWPAGDHPAPELTGMQRTYLAGSEIPVQAGGASAHLYLEMDGCALEPSEFFAQILNVLPEFPELTEVIVEPGVRGRTEGLNFELDVIDVRENDEEEIAAWLNDKRVLETNTGFDCKNELPVRIAVTLLPHGRHRIHFNVSMVAMNLLGVNRFFSRLSRARKQQIVPFTVIPAESFRETANICEPRTRSFWAEIPRQDAEKNDRHDAKILAAFCSTLAAVTGELGIVLNIAKLTVNDESISLFEANLNESEAQQQVLLEVEESLNRAMVLDDGLVKLRQRRELHPEKSEVPVVFTPLTHHGDLFCEQVSSYIGELSWISSQVPNVVIDLQTFWENSRLIINWDVRVDLLPAGLAEEMLIDFKNRLVDEIFDSNTNLDCTIPIDQSSLKNKSERWGAVDLASALRDPTPRDDSSVETLASASLVMVVQIAMGDCLGIPIEENDNFFQLGGDSLKATNVASLLRDIFDIPSLGIRELLRSPTPVGTAQEIAKCLGDDANEIAELTLKTLESQEV